MASKPPTESSSSRSGGILLVEEYSALGVAMTSALRKFAPLQEVRIAHTFAEAERIAAVMRPELFLLDLDPPPSGEIAFFHRLKAQHPTARMLVIAPGTSRELRTERGTLGAIQFIDKPFDLAEFGAAVQALLGPWALPHSKQFRGTLRDLHLIDLIQLKCLALSSTVVRLETDDGRSGAIYFRRGQICHVSAGGLNGAAALEEMVTWPDGHLDETDPPDDVPATINVAWPILLLPIARRLAEEQEKKSTDAVTPPAGARPGKKILVVDDTEMLLIFVADTLSTADETWQIITASSGAAGIRLATTEHPDLILLDYSLADMTGDRICAALLENAATARIPVLMMSGHPSELARTANDYRNVVATLPKPFLSGALINEVERLLANAPRATEPSAPAPAKTTTNSPPLLSLSGNPAAPLPNGRENGGEPTAPPAVPKAPPASPGSESPKSAAGETAKFVVAMERPSAPQSFPPTTAQGSSASVDRPMEVSVALALDVVSIQLTPSFRMEAATLQPCDSVVSVKINESSDSSGVPTESRFRLGAIRLFNDGTLDTLRVIPTNQPPQLPAAKSSFEIGGMSLERTNSYQNLQFTAPKNQTMRVLLTTQCELLAVELSAAFEVDAVVIKALGPTVLVRNSPGSSGAPFTLGAVELTPTGELRALLVRAAD